MERKINPTFRFFGVFQDAPPLHFFLIQFVTFAYIIYRLSSRDYTIYGFLPWDHFDYPFNFRNELVPIHSGYFLTFQFVYDLLGISPSPNLIRSFQYLIIFSSSLGLIGIFPRLASIVALILITHITGLFQSTDCPIDGGTIAIAGLFVLSIAPSKAFYGIKNGYSLKREKSHIYHWPITMLFLIVGCFYSFAGIAKIVDVGPHWPFVLHLENLSIVNLEDEVFLSSRYSDRFTSASHSNYLFSYLAGFITLIGEVFFITILTHPRRRLFLVFSMIILHVLVFLTAGINFIGSSFILLLCFDYNKLQRKVSVYFDGDCLFCTRVLNRIIGWDLLKLIRLNKMQDIPESNREFDRELLKKAMGLKDENGEIYYGADAFEQIFLRVPLLMPIGIFMQIPGMIYISRFVYRKVAKNRSSLGCSIENRPKP